MEIEDAKEVVDAGFAVSLSQARRLIFLGVVDKEDGKVKKIKKSK